MDGQTLWDVPPPPPRYRRWHVGAAAVAAAAAAAIAIPVLTEDDPVEAVEGYLQAIWDGDVEAAADHVSRGELPFGDSARFLAAEVFGRDWAVVTVEEAPSGVDRHGTVAVTVDGPDDAFSGLTEGTCGA